MVVSLFAIGAIYSTFLSQQKSYVLQGEVAAMQQNIRAAMFFMQREIRMAGCDPYKSGSIGFVTATANVIQFTEDVRGSTSDSPPDGDADDSNEDITYNLTDSDGDGDNDLVRNNQLVAQNIDALNFVYLDGDGNTTATLGDIRSVQITIVARTGRNLKASSDNMVYYNQQNEVILNAQNDNFSRKRLATVVNCRNLGL
jgi:type IV pilus assembly protein PilW